MNYASYHKKCKRYVGTFIIVLFLVVSLSAGNGKLPSSFIKRVQEHQKKRGAQIDQEAELQLLYTKNFTKALGHLNFHKLYDSPITNHERQELKLDWLCKSIDRTQTLPGNLALKETLTHPVSDKKLLRERQEVIKIFSQNNSLREEIKKQLVIIGKAQPDLQIHWVDKDPLHDSTAKLFFAFPFIHSYLNQSRLALDASVAFEVGKTCLSLATNLCLRGFILGLVQFTSGVSDVLAPGKWIEDGIKEPLWDHAPWRDLTSKGPANINGRYTFKEYTDAITKGTLGDRFAVMNAGFDRNVQVNVPLLGYQYSPNFGYRMPKILAAFTAVLPAIGKDVLVYTYIKSSLDYLKGLNNNTLSLRTNMLAVASLLRSVKTIANLCLDDELVSRSMLGKEIARVFDQGNQSEKLKELFDLLCTSTFDDLQTKVFYSRGRMLFAYRLLQEVRSELIPLLQLIGQVDLYANLSTYMTPQQDTKAWVFVDFVESEKPIFELIDFEAPVYKNSTPNSLHIGISDLTKILITGPNMGGKSAFIRLLMGQGVVLAQSLGIVPARSAKMTIIDGIFTSIDPQEDMKHGVSTFMAAKDSIDNLYAVVQKLDSTKKYIMLIDEPYSGTVNDETARLTGELCENLGTLDNLILIIATHIMPNLTEQDSVRYGYKHVEILEQEPGNFIRTFRLKTGICQQWFSNINFRRRYLNWLGELKKTSDGAFIEKMVPQD